MNDRTPFTPAEVLHLCGINDFKRVGQQFQMNCPFCSDHKKRMYVHAFNGMYTCHNCGAGGDGRDVVSMFAELYGFSDNTEAYKEVCRRLKTGERDFEYVARWKKELKKNLKETPLAPVSSRDKAYKGILSHLHLSEIHTRNLLERGFSLNGISDYKSATKLPSIVVNIFYEKGVPGFYKWKEKKCFTQNDGFYIPFRDRNGLIQGMQVRIDDAVREAKKRKNGSNLPKYLWVSSAWTEGREGYDEGCGGSFLHYACDFKDGEAVLDEQIFVTEGALKADLAHSLSGKPFLAMPGVNNIKTFEAELLYLKDRGVKKICNAFDMDYITNAEVKKASDKLELLIRSSGFEYERVKWDEHYKGCDDFLAALSLITRARCANHALDGGVDRLPKDAKARVGSLKTKEGDAEYFWFGNEADAKNYKASIEDKRYFARMCFFKDGFLLEVVNAGKEIL